MIATVLRASQGAGNGPSQPPKNRMEIIVDIKMICEYSARKNRAKVIAEYSVL
jgi:hypothetical protein